MNKLRSIEIYICFFLSAILAFSPNAGAESYQLDFPDSEIQECVDRAISSHEGRLVNSNDRYEYARVCYSIAHGQLLLNDFRIRRLAFYRQDDANVIILWMVVALTASGVLLAAVQLYVSHRLSANARSVEAGENASTAHEFVIEKDKIILRSSLAGLAILALSLAFFYIFVVHVYTITSIDIDGRRAHSDEGRLSTESSNVIQVPVPIYGPLVNEDPN